MFENIMKFFKKFNKKDEKTASNSKDTAKERLHLVLMQDRANVSADFLELMKQEIIEVIKKYIDVDEGSIDVRLTNKENADGTNGAPALYANIPILNIKNETRKIEKKVTEENKKDKKEDNNAELEENKEEKKEENKEQNIEENKTQKESDNKKEKVQNENEEQKEEKQDENKVKNKEKESSIKTKEEIKSEE